MGACAGCLPGFFLGLRRELALRRGPVVQLSQGDIVGARAPGGTLHFGGVPFAAAPAGARRWRRPVEAEPWPGRLDCTHLRRERRDWPLQAPGPGEPWAPPMSEDCLHLNLWVPAAALAAAKAGRRARAPVLLWIYGGGLQGGAKDSPNQEGRAYAERGIVFVSCNYRVGALGWLMPRGGDANCGLWDPVAALRWIKREVAAFGGDCGRVTIMGESAGADVVHWLCCSPLANGLFQQAIIQSASSFATSVEQAHDLADEFAAVAGAASAGLEDMQALSAKTVVRAQLHGSFRTNPTMGPGWRTMCFLGGQLPEYEPTPDASATGLFRFPKAVEGWIMPVAQVDGELLPKQPLDALGSGVAAHLRVVIGGNKDEMSFAELPGCYGSRLAKEELEEVAARLAWEIAGAPLLQTAPPGLLKGRAMGLLAEYEKDMPGARPQELLDAASTDFSFLAATQLAAARLARPGNAAAVYRYQFQGFSGRGGFHAAEMGHLLGESHFATKPQRQRVREQWLDSWAAFVHTGDPNTEAMAGAWRPYSESDGPIVLWDGDLGWRADGAAVGRRQGLLATARLWEELWGLQRALRCGGRAALSPSFIADVVAEEKSMSVKSSEVGC